MPQEQDIPAPVTTTIFFPLAMDNEIADSVRLVWESVDISSILREIVILSRVFNKDASYNNQIQPIFAIICLFKLFKSRRMITCMHVSEIKIILQIHHPVVR
jgi:hypothetical protein